VLLLDELFSAVVLDLVELELEGAGELPGHLEVLLEGLVALVREVDVLDGLAVEPDPEHAEEVGGVVEEDLVQLQVERLLAQLVEGLPDADVVLVVEGGDVVHGEVAQGLVLRGALLRADQREQVAEVEALLRLLAHQLLHGPVLLIRGREVALPRLVQLLLLLLELQHHRQLRLDHGQKFRAAEDELRAQLQHLDKLRVARRF